MKNQEIIVTAREHADKSAGSWEDALYSKMDELCSNDFQYEECVMEFNRQYLGARGLI